ncbi:MAG: Sec-independent protein translocase subunit TatA/TatB [Anaerolineae bacterium]
MSEFIFILVFALIILGPKDMEKAGKTIGKWMRDLVTSDAWKVFQQTSREIRALPNRLMREANEELNKIQGDIRANIPAQQGQFGAWDIPPARSRPVTAPPPASSPVNEPPTTPNEDQETNA